jgi:hypothetical protein
MLRDKVGVVRGFHKELEKGVVCFLHTVLVVDCEYYFLHHLPFLRQDFLFVCEVFYDFKEFSMSSVLVMNVCSLFVDVF